MMLWDTQAYLFRDLRLAYKEYELMQYTGLKDKNGKEIYEGDVVSYKYLKGFSKITKEIKAEVEFVSGSFGFYEYQREDDEYFNRDNLVDCIVIGNIYENPELLVSHETK